MYNNSLKYGWFTLKIKSTIR